MQKSWLSGLMSLWLMTMFLNVASAQDTTSLRENAPKIFLDCSTSWCDLSFFRQEINYVNFVRDRALADVYIMLTSIETGSGGDRYELFFDGQKAFEGQRDTVQFFTEPDDTEGEIREKILGKLKLGMLPYILQTPIAEKLSYSVGDGEDDKSLGANNVKDPWNFWTFSLRGNGWLNGESLYNSTSLNGNFNANRVTEKNKINAFYYYNYNQSNFYFYDSTDTRQLDFKAINSSQGGGASYIHSIKKHWAAGVFLNSFNSLYSNYRISTSVRAGIEYNFFPYTEAQRRQFTVQYRVGPVFNRYIDTTVFNRLEESLFRQELDFGFKSVQKWGSIDLSFGASSYLHDLTLNNFYVNPSISWNAFKGFNVEMGGFASIINDQISLAKQDLDLGEYYTRIRQFSTNYSYFGYFGVSYTFGSIYNNVVNPRMNGGGGGSMMFFN